MLVSTRVLRRDASLNAQIRRRSLVETVGIAGVIVALNIGIYLLPIDYGGFGHLAYLGVFLLTVLASGAFVLPIPYLPIVAKVAATVGPAWLVVVVAAVGSALGDSSGWYLGRVGKRLVTRNDGLYRWMLRVAADPIRTGLTLCLLAIPPDPLFDIAGLAAGALGVGYRTFFFSVLAGRLVHFALLALIAIGLEIALRSL